MKHVYFGWSPEATETFRWAGRKSPRGYGFNPQTAPSSFRWHHPAPDGRLYGQKDLKQAEARLVAYIAQAPKLIEIFENPDANLYCVQGGYIFKREIDKNKDKPLYTLCKSVIHAAHYDEGPNKMAWDTGLSVREARQFQDNYHAANPEIRKRFHEGTVQDVVNKGYLVTPHFNRKRVFYEALSFYAKHHTITDHMKKDAIAWRPQTTVPLIISQGIFKARRVLPPEVWIHHHGHDSVIWSVPADNQLFRDVEAVLDKFLDVTMVIHGRALNIPRETQCGYSVGELADYTGTIPTKAEWEKWVEKKFANRADDILAGIYGAHLAD